VPASSCTTGLFLYDHLAKREVLPGSNAMDLRGHPIGAPLKKQFTKGFVYSDGWVDDARLVVLNAIDAAAHGASVLTRWACTDARRDAQAWTLTLRHHDGVEHTLSARALINAAGPWAAQFLAEHAHVPQHKSLRLVKGSHIVVRQPHRGAQALQPRPRLHLPEPRQAHHVSGRLHAHRHDRRRAPRGDRRCTHRDRRNRLPLRTASRYFEKPIVPSDVVWSFSGVRPLLEDGAGNAAAVTRDYFLDLDTRQAPLLTVWGAPPSASWPKRSPT